VERKIAYMMSRFPKVTETFILYEILELEKLGLKIDVFPLFKQDETIKHPEAQALVERAHYNSFFSLELLMAQFYWLFRHPLLYVSLYGQVIRGNLTSPINLFRCLTVVPLAALMARQMQALGIHHVHAHWATYPALAAYIIKQLTGISYSFTAHAHDIHVSQEMLAEKISEAKFVITISEYNREFLRQLYGTALTQKVKVIYCGVDATIFQPRQTDKRNEIFTIVCVGSLEERKGQVYLVEACAELKAQNINFRCLLVGEGDRRPQIEAIIAKLGLEKQVTLLGLQPRHEVSKLLNQADAMVLPSITMPDGKKEGIPVALMEALAMQLPTIGTNFSGVPELIKDGQTGLLVPERDAKALATALLRLYHSPELGKKLGQAGHVKVITDFNLQLNTAKLYEIFSQV